MAKDLLHWGKPPQLIFESANEYYRALGHLTNSKAYSVSYEYNKKNGIELIEKASPEAESFVTLKTLNFHTSITAL